MLHAEAERAARCLRVLKLYVRPGCPSAGGEGICNPLKSGGLSLQLICKYIQDDSMYNAGRYVSRWDKGSEWKCSLSATGYTVGK